MKLCLVAIAINIIIFTILISKITLKNDIRSLRARSAILPKDSPTNISQEFQTMSENYTLKFPEVPPIQENLITYIHTPTKFCNNSASPNVLIVVHSSVSNFGNREIFRRTLGKYSKYNGLETRLVFVTGHSSSQSHMLNLEREASIHGDILTIAVPDKYTLLVYKTVGWMKWLVTSCKDVGNIIKIDDDTFLNMFKVSELFLTCSHISSEKPHPVCNNMSCFLWRTFKPHRKGKYSLSVSEYSRDRFPPFCPGLAILIPGSLVPRLLEATKYVQFLWLDDVYLTGLLMEYLGESHHNFGDKMMDPMQQMYASLDSGKVFVAHFKNDVKNGIYEKHWKAIEKL